MHHGVYEGAAAAAQAKKILILGESHHGEEGQGKRGNYGTREVVEAYLSQKDATEQSLQFFHKIARSFGIDGGKDEEKRIFWDKVYFGNYVDVICGIGGDAAEKQIAENREAYNQELAEFVKSRAIDIVFCFSFRTFDALPTENQVCLCDDVCKNGHMIWCARVYNQDSSFGRSVKVYGIPHPSSWHYACLKAEDIVEYLKPVFDRCCR